MSADKDSPLEFSAFDLMPSWVQEASKPAKQKYQEFEGEAEGETGRDRGGRKFERRGGGDRGSQRGGGGHRQGGRGGNERDGRSGREGGQGRFQGGQGGQGDSRGRGDFKGRGDNRGQGRGDTRGQGDSRGRSDFKGRGDSRGQGDFKGRRDFRGRTDDRGRGNREGRGYGREEDQKIQGLTLSVEPTRVALHSLARHIHESVKAYPVADLARLVVSSRERYQIRLKSDDNGPLLYQCKGDQSVWLNRDEAIAHFLRSPELMERYYQKEEVSVEPPKGNFTTIAVCGFSGEILGPPNHHEYQNTVKRLHREQFSNMSLERYKSRIEMKTGEEIVAKWHEKISKTFFFRLKPAGQEASEAPAAAQETPSVTEESTGAVESPQAEAGAAAPAEQEAPAPPVEAEPSAEAGAENQPAPAEEGSAAAETESGPVFKNHVELERHFRETFASEEIIETRQLTIPGSIPGKKLASDLFRVVKSENSKLQNRFPFELFQSLCSSLEKEGLKLFKRGKKSLYVSVARPQAIGAGVNLTERVQKIIQLVTDNPKIQTAGVLEKLCPGFVRSNPEDKDSKPVLDEECKAVLADIRWLSMEGFLLEYPDTHLELGKQPRTEGSESDAPAASAGRRDRKPPKKRAAPEGANTFTVMDLQTDATPAEPTHSTPPDQAEPEADSGKE